MRVVPGIAKTSFMNPVDTIVPITAIACIAKDKMASMFIMSLLESLSTKKRMFAAVLKASAAT